MVTDTKIVHWSIILKIAKISKKILLSEFLNKESLKKTERVM